MIPLRRIACSVAAIACLAPGAGGGPASPSSTTAPVTTTTTTSTTTAPRIDWILVEKAARRLSLIANGAVVRSYRIALGGNPIAHKQEEGDQRTPEGRYVIDYRKPDSPFHRALHISYPNEIDLARAEARGVSPGGAIMIHGLPAEWAWLGSFHRFRDWTDGCIAVTNEEIEEIWARVELGTPIEIRP